MQWPELKDEQLTVYAQNIYTKAGVNTEERHFPNK